MFLEVIKDIRSNHMKSFKLVSFEEMTKKHPYNLDLKGWGDGGRMNSRFGLSNISSRFVYVKTEKTDNKELESIARSL